MYKSLLAKSENFYFVASFLCIQNTGVKSRSLILILSTTAIHSQFFFFTFLLSIDPRTKVFCWHDLFIQVCMKPGKPLTFAEILPKSTDKMSQNKILAFGLPGNPVSCMVCFHLFLVPAMRYLSGWTQPHLPRFMKAINLCVSISLSSLFHINPHFPFTSESPF